MVLHADLLLARRVEAAVAIMVREYAEALAAHRPGTGVEVIEVAGGVATFAGLGSPITQALGLGMLGPVSDAEIDRVEAFFFDRGAAVQMVVCPLADPSLAAGLGARGYRPVEFENHLVRPVGPADGEVDSPPSPGVSVAEVAPGEAETWADVVAEGFAGTPQVPPDLREVARAVFGMRSATPYLARLQGEPAGGGSLLVAGGVGLLGGSAVLPGSRNRGVHASLIRARISAAARAGCDVALMGALPGSGSQRNVERMGFRVAYTRVAFLRDRPTG